jgi:replicative DNA helicase
MSDLSNVQAERYLIGSILINNDNVEIISGIVHPNDMTDQICRDLMFIAMAVRAKGQHVDVISLSNTRENLSAGQMTIAEAADIQRDVFSDANVLAMADRVKCL